MLLFVLIASPAALFVPLLSCSKKKKKQQQKEEKKVVIQTASFTSTTSPDVSKERSARDKCKPSKQKETGGGGGKGATNWINEYRLVELKHSTHKCKRAKNCGVCNDFLKNLKVLYGLNKDDLEEAETLAKIEERLLAFGEVYDEHSGQFKREKNVDKKKVEKKIGLRRDKRTSQKKQTKTVDDTGDYEMVGEGGDKMESKQHSVKISDTPAK